MHGATVGNARWAIATADAAWTRYTPRAPPLHNNSNVPPYLAFQIELRGDHQVPIYTL